MNGIFFFNPKFQKLTIFQIKDKLQIENINDILNWYFVKLVLKTKKSLFPIEIILLNRRDNLPLEIVQTDINWLKDSMHENY